MRTVPVASFDAWRNAARGLLHEGVQPEDVLWIEERAPQSSLPFAEAGTRPAAPAVPRTRVPRAFVTLAEVVACHRDADKWRLLYRLLWRLQHETRDLLEIASDRDVHAVRQMAAQVRRDEHKMRAFVRFTPVTTDEGERYVAWYAPDHLIARRAAPFFADRFPSMRWSILTPDVAIHWDLSALSFTEGVAAPPQASETGVEELWRTYYAAIFNPARLNLRATMREMPVKRWAALPEAARIPSMISRAHEQVVALGRRSSSTSARAFVPDGGTPSDLAQAAAGCRGCSLYARATQVVFGEGPSEARLLLIGEQPGDVEDVRGRPFVGPAGEVLDRALAEAGVDRTLVYLTNAVKHFSFEERGKRRIHKTPRMSEVHACRPWLEAELHAVRPSCVVCLGSTASRALLGPQARVMQLRDRVIRNTAWAPAVIVTVHPSAVLRADDGARYFAMLVEDLGRAQNESASARPPRPAE